MLSDKDGSERNPKWQWSRSSVPGTAPTPTSTKPRQAPTSRKTTDEGYFLRATVMYTDGHGSGKEASEMSAHASQRVRGDNSAPEFDEDQDPVMPNDQAERCERGTRERRFRHLRRRPGHGDGR